MSSGEQTTPSNDVPVTGKGRPVPQDKLDQVAYIVEHLQQCDSVALLRTEGIGSKQFQAIKKALRPHAVVHMARNTLMTRAIEIAAKTKEKLDKLIPYIEGSSAFAFANISPFELSDLLQQNKAKAPAKAGSVSPVDIVIPAGNTGFPPGPLISELGQVGLKTRIQGGSIWITADHTVVKAGETVTRPQALVLSRLGIEPYEIFLKLIVAYDTGIILSADVFEISRSDVLNQLHSAAQAAMSLALTIDYLSADTVPMLLQLAFSEAQSLALAAAYLTVDTAPLVLTQAEQQALALALAVSRKNPDAAPN